MEINRRPIFQAVRQIRGGIPFTLSEVAILDGGIDEALGTLQEATIPLPPSPTEQRDGKSLSNPVAFFDFLREGKLLGPVLTKSEVDGCMSVVEACGAAGWGISWTAYALATTYHETASTMQPISEYGGNAYFTRMYDIKGARPTLAKKMGNTTPGDGPKYHGRGDVQLTWKSNYVKANTKLHELGILKPEESLVDDPDLAKRPDIAAAIMVYGMAEGWFTGRKLSQTLPEQSEASEEAFEKSRPIINGTDRAADIAGFAVYFQKGLKIGGWK